MSWLDPYFLNGPKVIASAGVALANESTLNFVSGFTVADNPTNGRTDVTLAASGSAIAGDVVGTIGATVVASLTGSASKVAVANGVSLSWATGNGVLEVTSAAGTKLSLTFAGVEKAKFDQAHGMLTVGGSGTDFFAALGPLVSFETSNAALYLLPNGIAPTSGNCSMYADGTNLFTNCRWGSGSIHESFAGGSSVRKRDGANILLQESYPQIGLSTAWGSVNNIGSQAMADANQTPAAAVYQCTGIKTTGALTANRDLTLPTATDAQGYAKWINNTCTGAFSVNVKCAAGAAVLVANGKSAWMWIDSRGVTRMTADV